MARNLVEVIDAILLVIPDSESDFIAELKKCRESARYTSPETLGLRWERTAHTMWDYIGDKKPDDMEYWEAQALDIWNPGWREQYEESKPPDFEEMVWKVRKLLFACLMEDMSRTQFVHEVMEVMEANGLGQDRCELCNGGSGGVPGNENIIDGRPVCDYCSYKLKDGDKPK